MRPTNAASNTGVTPPRLYFITRFIALQQISQPAETSGD
jgi:hypothetical protein